MWPLLLSLLSGGGGGGGVQYGTGAEKRRQYYQQLLSGEFVAPVSNRATVMKSQQPAASTGDLLNIIKLLSGSSQEQPVQSSMNIRQPQYWQQQPIMRYNPSMMNYGRYT